MDGDESGLSVLDMKLLLTACSIHEREDRSYENSLSFGQRVLTIGGLGSVADGPSAVCSVEHLCISSICGHGRYCCKKETVRPDLCKSLICLMTLIAEKKVWSLSN